MHYYKLFDKLSRSTVLDWEEKGIVTVLLSFLANNMELFPSTEWIFEATGILNPYPLLRLEDRGLIRFSPDRERVVFLDVHKLEEIGCLDPDP